MRNPPYHRVLTISAPAARAWAGLTSPQVLSRWACDDLELELRPGGVFRPGGPHCVTVTPAGGQVLELLPDRRLELSWPIGGVPSTVRFDLEADGEVTRLQLTHSTPEGWPAGLDVPALWALQLTQLRWLLERPELTELPLRVDRTLEPADLLWLGISIARPTARVFDLLTQSAALASWLGTPGRIDAREGGRLEFGWGERGPTTVLALKKNRLLIHGWRDPLLEHETRVTWSFMPERGATRLEFLHEGLGTGQAAQALRLRWSAALALLQDYAEHERSIGLGWTGQRFDGSSAGA